MDLRKLNNNKALVVVGLFAFTVGLLLTIVETVSLDGAKGILLAQIFQDTTIYSENYTDEKFKRITVGISSKEAFDILGKPLEKSTNDSIVRWAYTKSTNDSHYKVRQLRFKNKTLISKVHYYLID